MPAALAAAHTTAAAPSAAAPAKGSSHAAQRVNGWGVQLTDVAVDPAVHFGRLPNGMKYAIRRNATPKGAASVRMHFAFGSIAEAEHERGLAHFIEHMAFNGTTNVPEGEMIKMLERQGLSFGPDTNAMTGFDATIYLLDLPKADAARLETAFFLMREVASEIRFDPDAVDRERGVIIGERRARDNYQLRRALENLEFHVPLAPYATRFPIGTDAVINSASAATLTDLYRRYYRPENATLVFVGDADPALIERMIRAKFSSWQGVGPAGAPLDRGKVDFDRPAETRSFTDAAVETSVSLSVLRPWELPPDTRWERRRRLIQSTAMALLTRRLQAIANSPDTKLLAAAAMQSPSRELAWTSTVSASAKDGEWSEALRILEQELRRALKHGFTDGELKVQLADSGGALRRAADRADTRSNQDLATAILSVLDENNFITRPQDRLAFFESVRPTVTVEEINAEFRRMWTGSNQLAFVTDKKPVGQSEIAAALESSRQVAVAPHVDTGDVTFAYDDFGPAGTVVADSRIADLGIRTIRFANNVRLNLKKTDFEKGSLRYSVRVEGGQLALARDKAAFATMFSTLSAVGALEKHSAEDLKKVLAGHSVNAGIAAAEDAFVAAGRTSSRDLPLQMKLSAAFVTAPGYRSEAQTRWMSMIPVIEGQRRATPQAVATFELPKILTNADPRFGLPTSAELAQLDLDQMRKAVEPALSSAPIEIGLVGDFDEQAAIDAVARSFGALPRRMAEAPDYAEARAVAIRRDTTPVTLTHSGQADQAQVSIAWPTDDDSDTRQAVGIHLLAEVLKLELMETLREKLGATYGASAVSNMSAVFRSFGFMTVSSVVAPDQVEMVERAIAEVVSELRDQPISADLHKRALSPILERIDRQQRENGYWISLVDDAQSKADRLDRHRKRRQLYLSTTPAELQTLARQFLVPERQLTVRIVSDRLPREVATR